MKAALFYWEKFRLFLIASTQRLLIYFGPCDSQVLRPPNTSGVQRRGLDLPPKAPGASGQDKNTSPTSLSNVFFGQRLLACEGHAQFFLGKLIATLQYSIRVLLVRESSFLIRGLAGISSPLTRRLNSWQSFGNILHRLTKCCSMDR